MVPTFCNRCGDTIELEEGCDPWDELDELDALSDRLRLKRYDLKRNINQLHSPIAPTFCNRCRDAVEEGCDPWDELAELDALSERLRLKRYDLKRKINQSHSPIIRQLPPDALSTIFEFCLPEFTDNQLQVSPYTEEDPSIPLSLGAICSYWRDIAWSTPSLWSSLVVRVKRKHESHITIVREWLARSGQLPLSIRIFSEHHGYNATCILALAGIINQYSTRWSDLDLTIPRSYYPHFCPTDNRAPILKSIRFRISCYEMPQDVEFQLTCPRLERASLSWDPIDIQWDNLTHLTLYSMSIFRSLLILRKTPRLVFCKVSDSYSGYREPSIGAPVRTSLRSLQLLVRSSTEYFLDNLIAPDLEEFNLPKYYSPSMEVITSFIRRSACSLRSFTVIFSVFPLYFEGFMNMLQSMPSLNTLSITSITATRYSRIATPEDCDPRNILQLVAKILSSQSTSFQQGFLPNLEVLEYTGNLNLRPESVDDLCPLPSTDNAVHGSLRLLKLNFRRATHIPKKMISHFSSLVERGITVKVLSSSEDILQSSIDFYRRKRDSPHRDWTDNLDSSIFS